MNAPQPITSTEPLRLEPPAVLLSGFPGTGKTHSLVTFVKAGLELFVLCTEGRGIETLIDAAAKEGVDINRIHWSTVKAKSGGIAGLKTQAQFANTMTYEGLSGIKVGIEKNKMAQYMDLLRQIENFHDERTGKDFGDVTSWGPDRVFVLDSLSGLNDIILSNTVGLKPAPAMGEWGVAQKQEMDFVNLLTSDLKCFFVLTSHLDRVEEEVTKMQRVVPAGIGSKVGPRIGKYFSEVVQAKRNVDQAGKASFVWSTAESTADLKNRALPIGNNLTPSFVPLVDAYKKRIGSLNVKPQT